MKGDEDDKNIGQPAKVDEQIIQNEDPLPSQDAAV